MRWLIVSSCILSGCFYLGQNEYRDIVVRPSAGWSAPELLTVIMEATGHNLLDDRTNVKAIATPYFPSVVKAIGRRAQDENHWSEQAFRSYVNPLLLEGCGMFVDWDKESEPVLDRDLEPLDSPEQFDRLMFLLELRMYGGYPAYSIREFDTLTYLGRAMEYQPPDVVYLDRQIMLVNERGGELLPTHVGGRKRNQLSSLGEHLFLKFDLRSDEGHFLKDSGRFFLVIRGFGSDIRLEFPAYLMK